MEVDDQENALLNNEQKKFVFLHYVNFADPKDMVIILNLLYTKACELEEMQKQAEAFWAQKKKEMLAQPVKEKNKKIDQFEQEEDPIYGHQKNKKKKKQ